MFLQFATSDREWPKDRFDKLRKLVIVNTATFLQRRHKHQRQITISTTHETTTFGHNHRGIYIYVYFLRDQTLKHAVVEHLQI